jgi:CheY-like chemotaxis protein
LLGGPLSDQPLTGVRVLVVEDSWQVAEGLRNLLRACGADVVGPVATTADALRLISEHAPSAALVDLNLRGGEQAHDLIDRLYEQGVRVIVTTGYSDVQVAKAAAILRKPIDEVQLLDALNRGPT